MAKINLFQFCCVPGLKQILSFNCPLSVVFFVSARAFCFVANVLRIRGGLGRWGECVFSLMTTSSAPPASDCTCTFTCDARCQAPHPPIPDLGSLTTHCDRLMKFGLMIKRQEPQATCRSSNTFIRWPYCCGSDASRASTDQRRTHSWCVCRYT